MRKRRGSVDKRPALFKSRLDGEPNTEFTMHDDSDDGTPGVIFNVLTHGSGIVSIAWFSMDREGVEVLREALDAWDSKYRGTGE